MQIVISLILLSFLILIHELGHLWGAKLFGVKVKEFSIFMGPKLFSFKTKKTAYSVRAIPIGGYVAMEGETEDSDDKDALLNKPRWQQAVIMFSGAFMNLLFGFIAILILTVSSGYMTTALTDAAEPIPDINIYIQDEGSKYDTASPAEAAGLMDGDRILGFNGRKVIYPVDILVFSVESRDRDIEITFERDGEVFETILKPTIIPETEIYKIGVYFKSADGSFISEIEEVSPGSPAYEAGIMAGDKIISIDNVLVEGRDDVVSVLAASRDKEVKIKILRDGKEMDIYLVPEKVVQEQVYYTGLYFQKGTGDFFERCEASVLYYVSIIKSVYYSILWLITGKVGFRDAMGPVGIVSAIGSVVSSRETLSNIIKQLLSLMGLISINLGFINLIPFPALDGSKLVILGIEAVTRKRIPIEKQALIALIGFAILIVILVAITSIDIMRLFGK